MKNKNKNKKVWPFVLLFAGAMVVCFCLGAFSAKIITEKVPENFTGGDLDVITAPFIYNVFPFVSLAILIIEVVFGSVVYGKAKKELKAWDGEDEEQIDKAETKLSAFVLISNIMLITEYILLPIWFHTMLILDFGKGKGLFWTEILMLVTFFAVMIYTLVMQRAAVELEKKVNPEKKGELLDPKFQKDWEGSCDEAEMLISYKACYKGYKVGNNVCTTLWLVSIFLDMALKIGYLALLFSSALYGLL